MQAPAELVCMARNAQVLNANCSTTMYELLYAEPPLALMELVKYHAQVCMRYLRPVFVDKEHLRIRHLMTLACICWLWRREVLNNNKIKGNARLALPAKEENWTADTLQKFLSIYQDLLVFAEWQKGKVRLNYALSARNSFIDKPCACARTS